MKPTALTDTSYDLSEVDLLASLPKPMRAEYERDCSVENYRTGDELITSHEATDEVIFILEGEVRIVDVSAAGRDISFEILGPGSVVGELAAIDGRERSAAVKAESDRVTVALMPAERFLDLVTHHPSVANAMLQRLAAMLRRSTVRIMELSSLGARNRVHAELLRLAEVDEDHKTARVEPMPVHSDIASRVSTTRESVARTMGELLRDGLVSKTDEGLLIEDYPALQKMVRDLLP